MRFEQRNNKKALLFLIALLAAAFSAWAQVSLPPALEIPRCPGNAAAFDCAELSDGLGAGHSSADAPGDNYQNADSSQPAAPDHQIRAFQYYRSGTKSEI